MNLVIAAISVRIVFLSTFISIKHSRYFGISGSFNLVVQRSGLGFCALESQKTKTCKRIRKQTKEIKLEVESINKMDLEKDVNDVYSCVTEKKNLNTETIQNFDSIFQNFVHIIP